MNRIMSAVMTGLVRAYQWGISPFIPARCRFLPTCSEYAIEAIATHGACTGTRLALQRLARCHPWGGSGLDPVPPHITDKPLPRCDHAESQRPPHS